MSTNNYIRKKIEEGLKKKSNLEIATTYNDEMDAWEAMERELKEKMDKAIEICKEANLTQSKVCPTRFYFDSTMKCWLNIYCGDYDNGKPLGFIEGTEGFYEFMKNKGFNIHNSSDAEIDLTDPDAKEILISLNNLIKNN